MRLHRLDVTAFGPFARTQRVDFDALSSGGLFLLHGPTGAGKTSVLDAVCYALYGSVPGARQQPGASLRSDHADPAVRTAVTLELTVAGRRLELTRQPEQLRPKARGSGTTRERARSELREWDAATAGWQGLSRSHQEIGEEVGRLLGMSREQFCQVVLLPQGDFARFLRSNAEDRARLLGRLFDTGRFAAVEERLAEQRRLAAQDVREGDEQLLALAQRMRQAAGTDTGVGELPLPGAESGTSPVPRARSAEQLAPGDPRLAETVLEWAALARTAARERLTAASSAVALDESRHVSVTAELESVRQLARDQQAYADFRKRAENLTATEGKRDAAARRLELARAAEAVAPAVTRSRTAAAEHRRAAEAETRARAPLPVELASASPEQLAAREGALRAELGGLAAAARSEGRLGEVESEVGALEAESAAAEELLREAEEWLTGWEGRRAALQRGIEEAQQAVARAEHLAGLLGPARERRDAARTRDALAARREEEEARRLRLAERAGAARETWLDLKERRVLGIAAELAERLVAGEPCAVCGSAEHPAPARAGAGHVDRAAEEQAFEHYQRADEAAEEAERRLVPLREQLAAATASAGDRSAEELLREHADLEQEHAAARHTAGEAHTAREALAAAEGEHARRTAARGEAERRVAANTSRREALLLEAGRLEKEVAEARGDAASVSARTAEWERRVELLAVAAEAARAVRTSAQHLEEAEAELADAARRADFATPQEATEALLGEAEQRELRERLARREAEEAAVAAGLEDPRLRQAAAAPTAQPAETQARLEEATRRLRHSSAAEQSCRTRCAELDRLSLLAAEDAENLAPLRESAARVAGLASLAAGTSQENEHRMRLESYVLAARLEQVAAAAGARLSRMSGGRYTLVHSDQRAPGRGRSGLALHVVDAWTGAERDTSTLSGGETFSASLALALGLADVVTEEAGGTRLETLFIDEGFGSLDEQTLDEVLDVLDSLRERDRCVGIVSHVGDLRQRIPTQLEVLKTRTGSALRHRSAPMQE
ncbi:AAA family ATPase [Streptomyces sulphureus]|uniref:AAA family ATPase n=1 Tax=Streptomyces sulphureus TaxID=47758 RepID=UPI000365F1BF|nr:SMC family ATPase [Streptomyces sulphureus]